MGARSSAAAIALIFAAGCGDKPPQPKAAAVPVQPAAAAPASEAKPAAAALVPKADADKELAARVKKALEADSRIRAQGVDVTASNGVVRLWGTVASPAEQKLARDIAASVPGVTSVESKLALVKGS